MLFTSFTYSPLLHQLGWWYKSQVERSQQPAFLALKLHHLDIGHPPPQEIVISMEGNEVLHNKLHIIEPAKVVMLCTLLDVNSLTSTRSLALISNNNEVLTITNMINFLIMPRSPLTCYEIPNLTILFRESKVIYKTYIISIYHRFSGLPRFVADHSAWGQFIGVHLYFIEVLL